MGKLTISMAIFNGYVKLPEGNPTIDWSIQIQNPKGDFDTSIQHLKEPTNNLGAYTIYPRAVLKTGIEVNPLVLDKPRNHIV